MLDLNKLKVLVENSADLTSTARLLSERDRDYYDGHQWTQEEISVLQRRRQPVITINRIKRKVDAMVGLEQRSRVDPRAYPRMPGDDDAADAATKALVFVDDNTRFDLKRSHAFEDALVYGYGGVEVIAEEKRGRMEIVVNRLRWEEIFFDPHSRERDFSDAAYMGVQKWMSLDAAMSWLAPMWEGDEAELERMLTQSFRQTQEGETYDDRPQHSNSYRWADERYKRVRVAQMYYERAGQWHLAIFCGGGEIMNDVSPYYDEDGKPCCPMELFTAYIDRENQRYGVVRDMISAQDEINKRRSKLLHQLNSRQTLGVKGAVDSVDEMKRELAAPDGHVDVNVEAFEDAARAGMRPFEIVQNQDQTSGQFSLLSEAKGEIDMVGPNAALMGESGDSASGRAILAQQQAGFAELAPVYDSLRDWTVRVYRAMWARIRQFWQEERWVRVTDEAGRAEFVGLNRVVGQAPVMDMMGNVVAVQPQVENPIAELDVDIIIEEAPDFVTLRQEEFQQLSELAQRGIPVPPEMIIEASSVRNKARLLEMMQEQREQMQQAQMMQAQQEAQTQQAEARASVAKDMASAQKTLAEVDETRADTFKTMIEARRLGMGF
jgi:hypothetical protein